MLTASGAALLAACGGAAAPAAAPTAAPAAAAPTAAPAAAAPTAAPAAATVMPAATAAPAAAAATAMPAATAAPAAAAATAAPVAAAAGDVKELTIIWAEWDPSNYLQELVNDYATTSGVKVKVVQEPWGTFPDRFGTEMAGKGTSYDLVVGDSQWLGQGSTGGWYVDLTDKFNTELNGKNLSPPTVTAYAEYPKGSGKYWAYPTEGDADGWAYRKDLFEDPAEMTAFKAKYKRDLAVPKTWAELHDIAEFFTRPDKNQYGVSVYTQKDYDALTMGFENVLFSYGADWGDYATYKVEGILNSKEGVAALDFYKSLYKFMPPGSGNVFWQESVDQFSGGLVAMAMNFFAFFPGLVNEANNKYASKTGFFSNPAGPTGKRFAALGGQGMSIVAFTSPERQAASMEFLKWFGKDDTQKKWAELGGYTCNSAVLSSPEFLENTPYNKAFAESMGFVKDFWAVPVYGEMMQSGQAELHKFIVEGEGTAQGTLDNIAKTHEAILKKGGLLK